MANAPLCAVLPPGLDICLDCGHKMAMSRACALHSHHASTVRHQDAPVTAVLPCAILSTQLLSSAARFLCWLILYLHRPSSRQLPWAVGNAQLQVCSPCWMALQHDVASKKPAIKAQTGKPVGCRFGHGYVP